MGAVVGLDHVQLAMPVGRETEAEAFYAGVLGMTLLTKPEPLASRGGRWFQAGRIQVHLGAEADFRPAKKAHPALRVRDLDELVERLGVWRWDDEVPQVRRGFTEDPFGNRIELIEVARTTGLPPHLGLVTLGVADVARATAFYEALGWTRSSASVDGEVSFFRTHGGLLALWGTAELSADAGRSADHELAINVSSRDDVERAATEAVRAGASLVVAPRETDWGGFNAIVADPDGHLWEIAHNPFWPLDADGIAILPA